MDAVDLGGLPAGPLVPDAMARLFVDNLNILSQRHTAWAVKDGISLFTRGEAKDGQRAVMDVGIKLHAASGRAVINVPASASFNLRFRSIVNPLTDDR